MAIVPLNLPPGMLRNGTEYEARGRWLDGNLIRWHDGAMRPIGGWVRRTNSAGVKVPNITTAGNEVVRDVLPYLTNNGTRQAIFASNKGLYKLDASNTVASLSPLTGFTPGSSEPIDLFGYGTGPYNRGLYNTRRNTVSSKSVPVQRWSLDTYGENVLAAGVNNGPIFEITPDGTVGVVANAPTDVADVITTDERIVMAIKNGPDENRQVIWSDREDNTEWVPSSSNFAGSMRLQGIGNLIGLYRVLNQVLILSSTDAYVANYVGAPFVYGFDRVGNNCEPVHPSAVNKTDRFVMWMGARNFWMYDGTLRQVPCDVMDHIAETRSVDHTSKTFTMTVSEFSELWWFYQGRDETEVSHYVVYNYERQHWSVGRLPRTAGHDVGVYETPFMLTELGELYNHEQTGVAITDAEVFAVTGPLELSNGQRNTAVRYVFLDSELQGRINLEFFSRQFPTGDDTHYGPYTYMNPVSTTGLMGREIRMRVNGLTHGWEFGTTRLDVQEIGGGFR